MSLARFIAKGERNGIALDLRSRLLFSGSMFFMNGEAVKANAAAAGVLRRLANRRRLSAPLEAPRTFWETAHAWYARGFLHIAKEERR